MTEFEQVLEKCLHDLEQGGSNVDDYLIRYPKYAPELEQILLTSMHLERAREARLSDAFKRRVRSRLIEQMNARPRRRTQAGFVFARLAAGLAAIVLALLIAGTVYAQNALPGEAFYAWKLASENAWRTVSPDPIGTDLLLAQRRANELIAVRNQPALYVQTLNAYLEMVARLKSEVDSANETRVLAALDSQTEQLEQSGITLPQLNQATPLPEAPTQIPLPTSTVTPLPTIVQPPLVNPTNVPEVVPTIQVPEIKPKLPKINPTIEIPPPIQ
jgi:hypothetical protein